MSWIATTGGRTVPATASSTTRHAARRFKRVGQVGWVAKGLVYVLVGVLFLRVALGRGTGGSEANQAGAVEAVASTTFGAMLLAALALGLVLYTAWRLFTVVLPGDWTGGALLKRVGYAVSALAYVSLLASIFEVFINRNRDPGSSEDRRIEGLVKTLLDVPAGRILVVGAGVVVIGIGIAFVRVGWTGGYCQAMSAGDHGIEGSAIDKLGTAGWIARGIAMLPIGFFLVRAAWTFNPDKAAGFDDSMRELASHPLGAVVAGLVGAGFVAYGVFAGLSARYQRLEGPRNDG
jgi:hypothetical protein